jgi:arabinogalactan endo-1,4-beta-galactosidase
MRSLIMINGISILLFFMLVFSCSNKKNSEEETKGDTTHVFAAKDFAMGVDLSYVNQVEDHGGVYRDSSQVRDPFAILKSHGANYVRVRLWHNPVWIRDVYKDPQTTLYSGYSEVEKTVSRAKSLGMAVNLDIHYSDFWADPGRQEPPAAWDKIKDLQVLKDSVYNYTFSILRKLANKGLMPDMVQIGNEINCGLMMTGTKPNFPDLNGCNNQWQNLGAILNSGIKAVRDASANSPVKPLVALHVADPKNIEWWFGKVTTSGNVTDFDVIGFSYYPLWHTSVSFASLPALITKMKTTYGKKVMILETGYPWATGGSDNYGNQFGSQTPLPDFPFTPDGQYSFMKSLTQAVITAGGTGIMYWEPAWITSQMKDSWGTGSSWENVTFFDFQGNALPVMGYMNWKYEL